MVTKLSASLITLVSVLTAVGCASVEKYDASLKALVGSTETEVVQRLGRPVKTYDVDGFHYLVYQTADAAYVPGKATSYQPASQKPDTHVSAVGGTPELVLPLACQTTIELKGGKVTDWFHKGNNCKSK